VAAAITALSAALAATLSATLAVTAIALANSFFFYFSSRGINSAAGGVSTLVEFKALLAGCVVGLVALN
jgi:hypothetical protein